MLLRILKFYPETLESGLYLWFLGVCAGTPRSLRDPIGPKENLSKLVNYWPIWNSSSANHELVLASRNPMVMTQKSLDLKTGFVCWNGINSYIQTRACGWVCKGTWQVAHRYGTSYWSTFVGTLRFSASTRSSPTAHQVRSHGWNQVDPLRRYFTRHDNTHHHTPLPATDKIFLE